MAISNSYLYLTAAPSDYTFNFLENVLDEVIQLFRSKYIHIGGDECPKESWKRSDFCQKLIGWRGEKGGIEAAQQKHDVIVTPTTYDYFDYAQQKNEDSLVIGGFLPLEKVYNYNPLPPELNAEEQKIYFGCTS